MPANLSARRAAVAISADVEKASCGCDALIDFTRPEGTLAHLAACRKLGVKMVIGTTGFSDAQKKAIADAARDIAIVMAPNMSVGTNLVFKLSDIAARVLNEGYDVEIIEAHHRHKVDAPSGTALHIGDIIAKRAGQKSRRLRGLRPRRRDRRAQGVDHRFCDGARRRHRRRSHGAVCRSPASASRSPSKPAAARPTRRAPCAPRGFSREKQRAIRHAGRAGPALTRARRVCSRRSDINPRNQGLMRRLRVEARASFAYNRNF